MAYISHDNPELQRPVSNILIGFSIIVALLLNSLPLEGAWLVLRPDFVAVVMLYWCSHKPLRVGMGMCWTVGLLSDVVNASVFGQNALAYTLLAFGGISLHHRLKMFDLRQQTTHVFIILTVTYLVYALVGWQLNGYMIWSYFLGCFTSTLLWVPLCLLFHEAQRLRVVR
jgi:rod shape-determining protein MreD